MNTTTLLLLFVTILDVSYGRSLEQFLRSKRTKRPASLRERPRPGELRPRRKLPSLKDSDDLLRSKRSNGLIQALLMLQKSVIQSKTQLARAIQSVKADATATKTLFKKELSELRKDVTTIQSSNINEIGEVKEDLSTKVTDLSNGQSNLADSVSALSKSLEKAQNAITSLVTAENKEQTTTLLGGQGEIKSGVTTIENLLTKEKTRFPNPVFGDVTADGVSKFYVEGHIEILHQGKWGTICENGFNDDAANILCKMGGYNSGEYSNGAYKQPSATKAAKIWLDEVNCDSDDKTIYECGHNPWGDHNCTHTTDVGIRCFY